MDKPSTSTIKGSDIQFVSNSKVLEQIEQIREMSPDLYSTIDLKRVLGNDYPLPILEAISQVTDFEATSRGGRGEFYRNAQQNPMVRAAGIRQLFTLISPDGNLKNLSPKF